MVSATDLVDAAKTRILEVAGGPARLQVIVVLAAVLGLDTAQMGSLSAVSDRLKTAFDIGNTEIGLLLAVTSFVGAIATLPMGILADRMRRQTILIVAVLVWAAAMILSGTATSYFYLLGTRLFLGAVTAVAWPCTASLTGDFFPARDRASIYGLILSGELIGAGIGFFVAGEVSSFASWRWAFFVMASPSIVLAWVLWRYLPEPERGGQTWLEAGESDPEAASRPSNRKEPGSGTPGQPDQVQQKVREARVGPRQDQIIRQDPTGWSWWRAMIYLLRLPTYSLLIVASTLAYFFFSGARAFAMIYFPPHYGLARSVAAALVIFLGFGALAGLLVGGRISRRLLDKGKINARIIVPAVALFLSVPFLAIGIWLSIPWIGVPVLMVGTGLLAAALAPIDAARLDIIHPRLWGRGEAGRMALRAGFEGGAPLLFGVMSVWLGGGTSGLMWTLLIMLLPMLIAGASSCPDFAPIRATSPQRRPRSRRPQKNSKVALNRSLSGRGASLRSCGGRSSRGVASGSCRRLYARSASCVRPSARLPIRRNRP